MTKKASFKKHIQEGYVFKGESIELGGAIYEGDCQPKCPVKLPLKTLNRHGLIAGATGTGKTVTVQIFAEQLSKKGVPVLLMDLKGDLSGLAQPGEANSHIKERHKKIHIPYEADTMPVELLSISGEPGVRLRATVSEFGPILLSKILDLNDTQSSILSVLFKFCDSEQLPLLDLKDLRKILQYATGEGKQEIEQHYGRIAESSATTILRKIIELEQQGGDQFFGERSFDVNDLLRTDHQGRGIISIMRLTDIQDQPKLFSTFMLCLLAEIYTRFPEEGDLERPKLAIFFDEAHLMFSEASKALLSQIETIIKLIRSKGVGIFFCTQNPTDIPDAVLGQLGLKVQHALRAFTARDRKMIKKTAENYPTSEFYITSEVLTSLGIGEALVTALNEKGVPTPLAATLLRAPATRMGILDEAEMLKIVVNSRLVPIYNQPVDRQSAYEILNAKIAKAVPQKNSLGQSAHKAETFSFGSDTLEALSKNTMARQLGRTVVREVTRSLLGVLGLSKNR